MPKQNKARVLFLCKNRIRYGVSFGLINSATFVSDALNKLGYESEVQMVVDGNAIDRAVTEYQPDVCILEAIWVTPRKLKEVARLHPDVKFVVRTHSNVEFIAMEGRALEWIAQYLEDSHEYPNIYVSSNSARFVNDMSDVLGHSHAWVYTPNVYFPEQNKRFNKAHKPKKNTINIGCFGAIRPLKNHLEQAVAAIKFADAIGQKLNFYVNSDRTEQGGDQVLSNLRALFENSPHTLVELPWQNHEEFMTSVSMMDVVMQVSFSETFNICAADAVSVYIPVVVSPEVHWVHNQSQAKPTSTNDIVEKLARAYKSTQLPKANRKMLLDSSLMALKQWTKVVDSLAKKED